MQSLPEEYSLYVFRVMEIGREPTLVELYEVICKAEEDLRIIAHDKTKKHRAEDKENDEHVTRRTEGFFYELVTKKRKEEDMPYSCNDYGTTSSSKNDETEASSKA
ncbi:hypothetical protein Tco_0850506 [Tanacetum coccineum]